MRRPVPDLASLAKASRLARADLGLPLVGAAERLSAGKGEDADMAGAAAYRGLVAQLYETDFPAAQAIWVEEFLVLLVELRGLFGNDLDKVIILSLIGQQMLRAPEMPAMSHADARQQPPHRWRGRDTNIDALARASHIPRESVRRKVNELIADGLVERNDAGGLAVRAGAAARLAPGTLATIAMLDAVLGKYLGLMRAKGLLAPDDIQPGAGAGNRATQDDKGD